LPCFRQKICANPKNLRYQRAKKYETLAQKFPVFIFFVGFEKKRYLCGMEVGRNIRLGFRLMRRVSASCGVRRGDAVGLTEVLQLLCFISLMSDCC